MIALDAELDGMRPSRIIQLSYLIIDGRRIRGKNFYFSVDAINRHARKVHGLGVGQLRKLSGGDLFAHHADEIYRDFEKCGMVIGHDVAGDMRYLRDEFARIGVEFPDYDYLSVAKAFGFDGCIVTKASQIPAAMEAARKSGGPYMIEVKLDGSFTVWPEAL